MSSALQQITNSTINSSTNTAIAHTALIAEGGGQRGIFTAGILDAWLEQNFNPFSLLIGTSAGAQNLSSYITEQIGFAHRSITELSINPKFFSLSRPLKGQNTVDLDWYFDQVNSSTTKGKQPHILDLDKGLEQLNKRQLLISTTNSSSYQANFYEPNRDNWLTLLKASSALPLLYKEGVKINDEFQVDGGLSAPLPVEEAYRRGARKIVVLRTLPKEYAANTPWVNRLKSWVCTTNQCPKALDFFVHHEHAYRDSLRFIQSPPKDLEIIQIFPEHNLNSKLIGSKKLALQTDYLLGKKAGQAFINQRSDTLLSPRKIASVKSTRKVLRYC
ncbi:patatin family protein [Shewanella sp. 1CM18E]|uniref:patatin-like phospholipase family protein n=1 Tax=Shewanella sp. 1CM18E TaxID=2929169 RepID=UPI0020BE4176|nr:patatin family protein [Shewanella sp. 1CM18E]MCK8047356.1 patatin family protein [Shewanella sp. 1CM18E]